MESIGEKLRTSREEKGLSIDQVARDTNIAKRYILALEEEAFSDFPGEPYLIGFLRNYADYLGLDAEEIVGLYKNFKIQEQPVPMEELLDRPRSRRGPLLFVVIILVVLLVVAGVLFGPSLLSKVSRGSAPPTAKAASANGTQYELKDEIVERRFVAGDTVIVPVGGKSYTVKLGVSGSDLLLTDAAGQQTVKLGQEKSIDLNGDGTPDLKVFLRQIDTRDPSHGIVVRFDRFAQSPNPPSASQAATAPPAAVKTAPAPSPRAAAGSHPPVAAAQSTAPTARRRAPQAAASSAPAARAPAPRIPAPRVPAPTHPQAARAAAPISPPVQTETVPTITPQSAGATTGPVTIMQNTTTAPFAVNIYFTGYCLVRYSLDGRTEDQRYFQRGESTTLDAKRNVEIWASNGGAMNVTIAGNSIDMGNPGQVVVRKIGWVESNNSGDYQLEMTRLQ